MKYHLQWLYHKLEDKSNTNYIFFEQPPASEIEEIGTFIFNQWYLSPFIVEGIKYKWAAQWMMAHKANLFNDTDTSEKIIHADSIQQVKDLGRQIKGFDDGIWNNAKFQIVRAGNFHKFSQNPKLGDFLSNTGDAVIVEANPSDKIWGIGFGINDNEKNDPHAWRGENLLGFALMEVRDLLRVC